MKYTQDRSIDKIAIEKTFIQNARAFKNHIRFQ